MSIDARASTKARRALASAFSRGAREPLVQFLAVALVLFAVHGLTQGPQQRQAGEPITISEGRVLQIAERYRLLAGRLPSRAELQVLVNDFIDEEIAYREAVAMGLDIDDTIVRRRLRQKLEFLAEDAEAPEEPSDEQLGQWLRAHAADYRLPRRVSFRQVLASSDTRGARARADAAAFLAKLDSGADPGRLGDASMLPSVLPLTSEQGVALVFGEQFASSVFQHAGEGWFGPVASPFGAHAVRILSREAARDPSLDEVRDKLRSDWIEARRKARREAFRARLREQYEISIDWPEPYASQAALADASSSGARGE